MKNALMVINPYLHNGIWVFDDESTELVKEPFIAGIDTMLYQETLGMRTKKGDVTVIFSPQNFPGSKKLVKRKPESGGAWYFNEELKLEGWLCPATLKYFPEMPEQIHYQINVINK